MRTLKAIVGALFVASLTSVTAGQITGEIKLKGTPPPEKDLPLDPACGKLWANEKPKTRFYAVGADHGLGDVFVYLKGVKGAFDGSKATPTLLDQKGCEYTPYVIGAQTGQKVLVRNSDPVLHNVHGTPKVNKEFNLAQMAGGKDIERTFEQPEVFVRFKCDVHVWMFAYLGVVPHPFFAVSDKDGKFSIKDVPAGKYQLVAFHRKAHGTEDKALVQEITVGEGKTAANFSVDVAAQ